uniref:Uncharacterized protein n=1 Tax=OCS116 cluster bacterium TaxID=2030921 RepID=A0A2A4YV58_9PROT
MFKYIVIISLFIFGYVPPVLAADKNPNKLDVKPELLAQIDSNWHLIDITKGDLNKDGIEDYVLVVEADLARRNFTRRFYYFNEPPYIDAQKADDWESEAADREFMVFLAQKSGAFEHVFSHSDWVGRADFGGTYGDSYGGIDIDNGAIVLSAYGGSRIGWNWTMRIRHQEDRWRVIGFTSGSLDRLPPKGQESIDWDRHDRNLLTYKVYIEQEKAGKMVRQEWNEIVDKTKIYLIDSRQPDIYKR